MLGTLVYGVVPPGFVQVAPSEGTALALEAGRVYALSAWGEVDGIHVFSAV